MFVADCSKRRVSSVQDHGKVECIHIKASHISSAKAATETQILRATF